MKEELPESAAACGCFLEPHRFLLTQEEMGMDAGFGLVTLLTCSVCGQLWLKYFYEVEAFTGSGRWYLGAVQAVQAAHVTAENAREILGSLDWYFYGGSYYGGKSGRTAGRIFLNP